MPRVSEKLLPPQTSKAIVWNLKAVLKNLAKEEDAQTVVYDLFTPQEKEMLSKRLAIGILIHQNTHYRQICETLKVTPTTIQKIKLEISRSGRYRKFLEKVSQTKSAQTLQRLVTPKP